MALDSPKDSLMWFKTETIYEATAIDFSRADLPGCSRTTAGRFVWLPEKEWYECNESGKQFSGKLAYQG
ncbi:hypothetical protein GCM10028810_17680 [Spirosoma litoris]